jgi:hypothetical protein
MMAIVIGKKRNEDNVTAKATEGSAMPDATVPKNMICAGPAHINRVESAATPAGAPVSRAMLPIPIKANATTHAGNCSASFVPVKKAALKSFFDCRFLPDLTWVTWIASDGRTKTQRIFRQLLRTHKSTRYR